MIYDYDNQDGYVSVWVGRCKDYDTLDEYLSTVYLEDDYEDGTEPGEIWKELFAPANRARPCEEELKEAFHYEFFNRFENYFGMSFDEDFREAAVREDCTENLEELLAGFSYSESFLEEIKNVVKKRIPKCNAAVVLYNFKYDGGIINAEHEDVSLQFVGYAKY